MTKDTLSVIHVHKGATIRHGDREYVITRVATLNSVLCKEVASGQSLVLRLGDLDNPQPAEPVVSTRTNEIDLEDVPKEAWATAEHRRDVIAPLLVGLQHGKGEYRQIATRNAISVATLYRWVTLYRNSGHLLSSLIDAKRSGGKGRGRLVADVEAIVGNYITNDYLSPQKLSIQDTVKEIRRRCHIAGLPLPAPNTIRLRLAWIEEREKTEKRHGIAAARDRFDTNTGSITDDDAKWPLSLVEIDHTLLAVIIVDDQNRKPIGRAWITLAIDVFSRVVLGMHLSLDAPSANSVGICVANCILLKNKWLQSLDVPPNIEWPFYGVMEKLHCDNAREFRGEMLEAACNEYGIDLHLRPVKNPQYGAHIERLMGTVTTWLKAAPGATFSGPKEKGDYDAEGNACLTFDELEKWLVNKFTVYHFHTVHRGIGTTPAQKWQEGIVGTKTMPARGLPPLRTDEDKVRFDFMPFVERTIQNNGVSIDNITYYDDVLRSWIGIKDPEHPGESKKHRFRRDPHDISEVYFFDPKLQQRFTIRSRLGPVSLWDWRKGEQLADEQGIPRTNEVAVFQFATQRRALETEAAEKNRAARRAVQQREQSKKRRPTRPSTANQDKHRDKKPETRLRGYDASKIKPIPEED